MIQKREFENKWTNIKRTMIDNLTNNVNVNTLDINTLNTTVSSGFWERYTKAESDIRYYTKLQVEGLINNSGGGNVDTSLFVQKSGSVMTGNLTTSGDIEARDS